MTGNEALNRLSQTAAAAGLAEGRFTAGALLECCLAAIARDNGRLNAFVHIDAAGARLAAAATDMRRQHGRSMGALDGIVIAVKANIAVKDWPHSAGFKFRRQAFAVEDAFVVRRLRAAGAVLIGSTNMDEGALGTEGNNPWFGAIQNPLRQGYSPGGSSGGSAAAIAGGLCIAALGSDTIGSIRIPAAFCGCVGLKPSSGLVSVGGVLPVHSRFDHVGPLVRAVEDLPAMLAVLAGHDPTSSVSFPLQLTPPRAAGTPRTLGYGVGLDPAVIDDALIAAYNQGISRFRRSGASLIPIDLRRWDLARLRRAILALCEAQMSREHREHMNSTPDDYSDGLRAFIRYGGKLGSAELTQAETRIANFYREWQTLMQPLDAVILPTVTCTAFPHGARYPHNTADLTAIATATGLPALSLPLPIVAEELPFGLQIIGRPAGDLDLMQIALDYAGTAAA